MQSRDFCYWLQGYFEMVAADGHDINPTPGQMKVIQKHLALVFKHEIDPAMGDQGHQDALNSIHSPGNGLVMRC